jgi:hypothetical protein
MSDEQPIISFDHLACFGAITTGFAKAESTLKLALAAILDTDPATAHIISEPYGSIDLQNVLRSLAKIHLEPEDAEKIVSLTGVLKTHRTLRNHIAHNQWTCGTRKGALRPVRIDIRQGHAAPAGFEDDTKDYTLPEIYAAAEELSDYSEKVLGAFHELGFMEIIEKNIDWESVRSELDEGSS